MKSVMKHNFSEVPAATIPRSTFDRSHGHKTTFDEGYLVPIFVDEALPGDTFRLRMSMLARLATPLVPLMDNIWLSTFFFAVPIRLLWTNWKKFNGQQTNPGDSTSYTIPQIPSTSSTGFTAHSLGDYFGLPVEWTGQNQSALPFRAYNLIWNEWFRDQNIQNSITVDTGDGPDTASNYVLRRINKKHDYFTSCLPWPQKGTAVSLPLGTTAPVVTTGVAFKWKGDTSVAQSQYIMNTGNDTLHRDAGNPGANEFAAFGDTTGLQTDLSSATAATINQLRQAFQIQKLYERDARGGTRYTEIIRAHFGVISPDARQQRPEYLGGGTSPLNITPVPQTSNTPASGTPQGNLAGYGIATAGGHGFTKSFTEHCVIIGLIAARADLNYQQGMNRMWTRSTRWDFYWPALSHIGEQAVTRGELYYTANSSSDNTVFGYQERYAEYRYKPSLITGKFRTTFSTNYGQWHLAQKFTSAPTLSDAFIREEAPMTRVIAVTTEPHFLFDSYFDLKCARPMPLYGVPGLIDHF